MDIFSSDFATDEARSEVYFTIVQCKNKRQRQREEKRLNNQHDRNIFSSDCATYEAREARCTLQLVRSVRNGRQRQREEKMLNRVYTLAACRVTTASRHLTRCRDDTSHQ